MRRENLNGEDKSTSRPGTWTATATALNFNSKFFRVMEGDACLMEFNVRLKLIGQWHV
jgi:hypothetical protein